MLEANSSLLYQLIHFSPLDLWGSFKVSVYNWKMSAHKKVDISPQ